MKIYFNFRFETKSKMILKSKSGTLIQKILMNVMGHHTHPPKQVINLPCKVVEIKDSRSAYCIIVVLAKRVEQMFRSWLPNIVMNKYNKI